jgi:5-methyltetrahydrofolate--homocysteine methyltransferase
LNEGILSFFAANSTSNDNILLYENDERKNVVSSLNCLRQQSKDNVNEPYYSLSDFIAPIGHSDYIGCFAIGIFGIEKLIDEFKNDDYNIILSKAIADRLAEAFAEVLHEEVRKKYWAYSPDENMDVESLLKVKYQGFFLTQSRNSSCVWISNTT